MSFSRLGGTISQVFENESGNKWINVLTNVAKLNGNNVFEIRGVANWRIYTLCKGSSQYLAPVNHCYVGINVSPVLSKISENHKLYKVSWYLNVGI